MWNDGEDKHLYHLASWNSICLKKEYRGFGVPNLIDMNLRYLASWIRRYNLDENKMWRKIIDYKCRTRDPNIFTCPSDNASPFWKGVLWACQVAKLGFQWKVGNGIALLFDFGNYILL